MGNSPCSDHICAMGLDENAAINGLTARLLYNNKTVHRDGSRPYVQEYDGDTRYYYKVEKVANRMGKILYHCVLSE